MNEWPGKDRQDSSCEANVTALALGIWYSCQLVVKDISP